MLYQKSCFKLPSHKVGQAVKLRNELLALFRRLKIFKLELLYKIILPYLESQTIEDFGHKMALHRADVEHLRSVFMAVENGDIGMLKSLGIRVSLAWHIS